KRADIEAKVTALIRSEKISALQAVDTVVAALASTEDVRKSGMDPQVVATADFLVTVRHLVTRKEHEHEQAEEKKDEVLVLQGVISPEDFLELMDHHRFVGIVLERGSEDAHIAIKARQFNIPAIVGAKYDGGGENWFSGVEDGIRIVVDAINGVVFINADANTEARFGILNEDEIFLAEYFDSRSDDPAVVDIAVNAESPEEAGKSGVKHIHLVRSEEMPVFTQNEMPQPKEVWEAFTELAQSVSGQVRVRALDLTENSNDKKLPWVQSRVFGIQWILTEGAEVTKLMIREAMAVNHDFGYSKIEFMFPQVSTKQEVDAALQLVQEVCNEVQRWTPELHVGFMIETVGAVRDRKYIVKRSHFVSIGSNDLTDALFGLDRNEPSDIRHNLQPKLLHAMRSVVRTVHEHNLKGLPGRPEVSVCLCGNIAADAKILPFTMAMNRVYPRANFDLSMPAGAINRMKEVSRQMDPEVAEATYNKYFEAGVVRFDNMQIGRDFEQMAAAASKQIENSDEFKEFIQAKLKQQDKGNEQASSPVSSSPIRSDTRMAFGHPLAIFAWFNNFNPVAGNNGVDGNGGTGRGPSVGQAGNGGGAMVSFARSRKITKDEILHIIIATVDTLQGWRQDILSAIAEYQHASSDLIQRYVASRTAAKKTAKDHIPAQSIEVYNLFILSWLGALRADGKTPGSIRVPFDQLRHPERTNVSEGSRQSRFFVEA
ncbi:MAG: hypothetical protein KAR31_04755, partial [Candidatus Omnitrophica bacterium]|nr:hypothetical protein [Candidatus Omnitrophota bacterium]